MVFSDRGRYNFCGGHIFGGISVKDNEVTTTLNSSAITLIAIFTTDGPAKRVLPDATNNRIIVKVAGIYKVTFYMHMNNEAVQSHVVDVSMYKNNGTVELENVHGHRTLTGGVGDVGSMSGGGDIEVEAGDTLELWATTDSGSDRIVTFEDVSVGIVKMDD